jgi:hypothetical protein
MKQPESPRGFAIWACGDYSKLRGNVLKAEGGTLVGVPSLYFPEDIAILVDFSNRVSWPDSWHREVNDDARDMLRRLRREHPDVWLSNTSDHELTRPRTSP